MLLMIFLSNFGVSFTLHFIDEYNFLFDTQKNVFLVLAMIKKCINIMLCITLLSITYTTADTHQPINRVAEANKLPLVDFSYKNGNLTKQEAQELGFYRIHNKTTLKLEFICDPKLLDQVEQFNLTFKVGQKKHSASKSKITVLSGGVELASRKGAGKGKWVSMKIPTSKLNKKSSSLEIILKGGDDKLHVECKGGVPLVEINTGLPIAEERKQAKAKAIKDSKHVAELRKSEKRMEMRAASLKNSGIYVREYFWFNKHRTRIDEDKPAFVVGHPNLKKIAEGDLVEGYFAEDGTINIGSSRNSRVVRKLRWIRNLEAK